MPNEVGLTGVPETMLWTLHNRAVEAKRSDGILHDPDCVRIYDSIDYDYQHNFGKPDGTHAERARIFDDAVRAWLAEYPTGTVVELGAGLETQFQRCDNGTVSWICVDVEESITVRERFLPAGPRCRHIACSALDLRWIDEIAPGPVFITAQGLFMYFSETEVRKLITSIVDRLPGVELMFDAIPPWFSRKTMKGFAKTATTRSARSIASRLHAHTGATQHPARHRSGAHRHVSRRIGGGTDRGGGCGAASGGCGVRRSSGRERCWLSAIGPLPLRLRGFASSCCSASSCFDAGAHGLVL